MVESVANAGSWAEMVQAIDKERKRLPWNPIEVEPVIRTDLVERRKKEREFNPVAMQFRDPLREKEYMNTRASKTMERTLKANEQLNSKFNIVSHQGPPRKIDTKPKVQEEKPKIGNNRGWHILSHLKEKDHFVAPIHYDEERTLDKLKRPAAIGHRLGPPPRDFNVLSNKFIKSHEEREDLEHQKVVDHVTKKYWQTHDFDLLRGRYYDSEKEKDFLEQRELVSKVHGKSKIARLPPSVLYSEGNAYNIIDNTVVDQRRLETTTSMANRSLHKIKDQEVQQWWRDRGDAKFDLEDERKMNRPNYKRWESQVERDYDMVTNLPVKERPFPRPFRPATVWDRLQQSLDDGTGPGYAEPSITNTINMTLTLPATAGSVVRPHRNIAGKISIRPMPVLGRHEESADHYDVASSGVSVASLMSSSVAPPLASPQTRYSPAKTGVSVFQDSVELESSRSILSAARLQQQQQQQPRPVTERQSARSAVAGTARSGTSELNASSRGVPSLNLSLAEPPESVVYSEPAAGPPGLPVAMVRTGGLSGMRA